MGTVPTKKKKREGTIQPYIIMFEFGSFKLKLNLGLSLIPLLSK